MKNFVSKSVVRRGLCRQNGTQRSWCSPQELGNWFRRRLKEALSRDTEAQLSSDILEINLRVVVRTNLSRSFW
jgi:hypothetical protein